MHDNTLQRAGLVFRGFWMRDDTLLLENPLSVFRESVLFSFFSISVCFFGLWKGMHIVGIKVLVFYHSLIERQLYTDRYLTSLALWGNLCLLER